MRKILGAAVALVALCAAPAGARRARTGADPYQRGLELYSHGRLREALSQFEEALRREPDNVLARNAARHIERDLLAERAGFGPEASAPRRETWSERLDDWLLDAGRWARFEAVLGDRLSGLGGLRAAQGRVRQLLAERRLARALHRRFRRDNELRAMVRRLPAMTAELTA